MKKILLINTLLFFSMGIIFAQTTATDFTADDCNGVTHNLFNDLDSGDIIVISWVMPCAPCATYTLPAYAAVQSFASTHPGQVNFYLVDDYANTACPTLVNWGNSNSMPLNTAFSDIAISMSDYGSNGMPKVVVLGGSDHNIYYNENDNKITFAGVQTAISDALLVPLAINDHQNSKFDLISFPNPTKNGKLNISYRVDNIEKINFDIINVLGETVHSFHNQIARNIGQDNITFDISKLTKGTYFLRFSTLSHTEISRFVVAQ
jgi:hypothetical protein